MDITLKATDSSGNFSTALVQVAIGNPLTDRQQREAIAPVSDPNHIGWNFYHETGAIGLLSDVARTQWTGSQTLVPGTTYNNKEIPFDISPPAVAEPDDPSNDIILNNCWVKGTVTLPGGNTALIRAWGNNHAKIKLYDCYVKPQNPNPLYNWILGHDIELYRTLMEDACDFSPYNTYDPDGPLNVKVRGCAIQNHAWYSHDDLAAVGITSNPDGAHPDGVQLQGGSGFSMVGTRVTGQMGWQYGVPANGQPNSPTNPGLNYYGGKTANAAMMIRPDVGLITNMDVHHNFFDGGGFPINMTNDGTARLLNNPGSISNNKFGRLPRGRQMVPPTGPGGDTTYTIVMPPNVVGTFDGNVYADTGAPILVRHNGG